MLAGAYSNQYKIQERADIEALKEIALSEKNDTIAKARKLSQETNKRRKTMAQKKKAMAQREEKRRQEILARRREEQCKATEKYQRSNLGSARHGHRRRSPRHSYFLEDALRLVRGSSAGPTGRSSSPKSPGKSHSAVESSAKEDPLNRPYFHQYSSRHLSPHGADKSRESLRDHKEMLDNSLRNFNNSRNLFEQQLEQHQQLLMSEQQKSLHMFNEAIRREMERDVDNQGMEDVEDDFPCSASLSSLDSLEQSQNSPSKLTAATATQPSTHPPAAPPPTQPPTLTYTQPLPTAPTPSQPAPSYAPHPQAQASLPSTQPSQQTSSTAPQPQFQGTLSSAADQGNASSGGVTSVHRFAPEAGQVAATPKPRQVQAVFWNGEAHPYTRPEYSSHLIGPIMQRTTATAQHHPAQEQVTPSGIESEVPPQEGYDPTQGRSVSVRGTGYRNDAPPGQFVSGPQPNAASAANVHHTVAWATPQPSPSSHGIGVSLPDPGVTLPSRDAPSYVTSQPISQPTSVVRSTAGAYSMGMGRPNAAIGGKATQAPRSTNTAYQYPPQGQKTTAVKFGDFNTCGDASAGTGGGEQMPSPSSPTDPGRKHLSSFSIGDNNSNKENVGQGSGMLSEANLTQGTMALVKGRLVMLPTSENAQKASPSVSKPAEPAPAPAKSNLKSGRIHSASDLMTMAPAGSEKKGILKRPGGSGTMTKAASVSALNQNTVKDSLELAKTHYNLQGNKKKAGKKSVRWTDLQYNDSSSDCDSDSSVEGAKVTSEAKVTGRARPASAKPGVGPVQGGGQGGGKTRSSSAGAARPPLQQTTPSHANNRPKAAAHIITHSMEAMELAGKTYAALQAQIAAQDAKAASFHPGIHAAPDAASKVAVNSRTAGGITYTVASHPQPQAFAPGAENGVGQSAPASSASQPQAAVRHQTAPIYNENGLRIDRTPTDEEINFLWEKVRTCLNRTAPSPGETKKPAPATCDVSRTSAPMSHKYIDGATLAIGTGKSNLSLASTYSQPNSYPSRGIKPASANGNTYLRRYGLLQQRRAQSARQPPSRPLAVPSSQEPQHASAYHPQEDISESLAGFLVAEQLAGQSSLGESQIQAAIEEAQSRQNAFNMAHPSKKVSSALSMEEQRLLESLDRLNEKLKICEAQQVTAPANSPQVSPQQPPPAPQGAGFRGRGPRIIQRRTLSSGAAPLRINNLPQTYR